MEKKEELPLPWERSRILLGLLIIYAFFEGSAQWLGSDRGQAGLIVGAIVIATGLGVERVIFGRRISEALLALGLGLPTARGYVIAIGAVAVLLLMLIVFGRSAAISIELTRDAFWLMPGLFAQGGVGEEMLFRGFLYRHFRSRRSRWHAATLSMLPFAAVHLLLFLALPWHIALAGWLASVALSFPLAHLFEISGNSLWPPALVHFVIQAVPKVVVVSNAPSWVFPIFWMILTVLVLWLMLAADYAVQRKLKAVPRFDAPFPGRRRPDDRDTEGRAYVLAKH